MTLAGQGKFHKYQGKAQIFVFATVSNDSQFPFQDGDHLDIEIVTKSRILIIRKKDKTQQTLKGG